MVKDKWDSRKSRFPQHSYSLDIWHGCLQSLRQHLRGWNLKCIGEQKEIKLGLTKRIEEIDMIAEGRLLSMEEWEERIALEGKLEDAIRWDELQWKQKASRN
jgi:hypothetical protein